MSYDVWREPPEADDPLSHVERPRERKPWKRDRYAIQAAMNRAINERCWANPMVIDSHGKAGSLSKDHSLRFRELNFLHARIQRYRWEKQGKRRSWRLLELGRMHSLREIIPYYDKPKLP